MPLTWQSLGPLANGQSFQSYLLYVPAFTQAAVGGKEAQCDLTPACKEFLGQ